MEMFLMRRSDDICISTARFANVAFSDGSLLHGFNQRIQKHQPLVAPKDIKRYFVTPQESGELCLMSCIFGESRDIFFPKLSEALHLITFADIAVKYLSNLGYKTYLCESEDEARDLAKVLPKDGIWPCLFTISDTTGEKDFEEFFTENELLDMCKFNSLGIIKNKSLFSYELINEFENTIKTLKINKVWTKNEILELFKKMIPNFSHKETSKYLDGKM
jgi:FlaA1/EpsC-like NDP-sugar epimerase